MGVIDGELICGELVAEDGGVAIKDAPSGQVDQLIAVSACP